jgi:hypothetical protein
MTVASDLTLSQVKVLDSTMAYREMGDRNARFGLFLHGNTTSSYIWRHFLPVVAPVAHGTDGKSTPDFGTVHFPKTIVFGKSRRPVSPAFAERFSKRVKNCRLVQLCSGLHFLQEDHPDVIAADGRMSKNGCWNWGVSLSPSRR